MELDVDPAEVVSLIQTPWDLNPAPPRKTFNLKFTIRRQIEADSKTTKEEVREQLLCRTLRLFDNAFEKLSLTGREQLRVQLFEQMYAATELAWNSIQEQVSVCDVENEELASDADELLEGLVWLTEAELKEAFAEAELKPDASEWSPESETLRSPYCP